ncbi:MAG TPA: hypothetical protein VGM28_03815 [Candidatus Limnocylindrales bacterium]
MISDARRALVAIVMVSAAVLGGCTDQSSTPGPVGSSSISVPANGTPAVAPASPIDGVLTHIDSTGLTQVTGFRLRTNDGQEIAFTIGTLENGDQFPPGHLAEHLATSSPVRVWFRDDGSNLVVYRLEDTPLPP